MYLNCNHILLRVNVSSFWATNVSVAEYQDRYRYKNTYFNFTDVLKILLTQNQFPAHKVWHKCDETCSNDNQM
jgi:hypothetical protein